MLVLAVLVLAVEGYFGYRWYQRYYGAPADTEVATSSTPGGGDITRPEEPGAEGAALVHRATSENIVDNSTYVDHPASNGNPNAVLLVTQAWAPDGTPANPHPMGVWYDANRGGRWAIFNQDLSPMPVNAAFNVVVLEEPGGNTFVHRATRANTEGENTYIAHPSADGTPEAVLSVTPNWNPGGSNGSYEAHPVGVWYDTDRERWAIRNQDLAAMPNAAFGVSVLRNAD